MSGLLVGKAQSVSACITQSSFVQQRIMDYLFSKKQKAKGIIQLSLRTSPLERRGAKHRQWMRKQTNPRFATPFRFNSGQMESP
jgi:hypothetical protein